MSRDCCVALPHDTTDLSVVCDCGISWSYSPTIVENEIWLISNVLRTPGRGYQLPIYDIVRMCNPNSPLFQRCQVYDKPLFPKKKYMKDPVFHHWYMNGPIFWHPYLKILIFCPDIQLRTKIVKSICELRLQIAKRVKNQRRVYEYVNILFNQAYELVIFFQRPSLW